MHIWIRDFIYEYFKPLKDKTKEEKPMDIIQIAEICHEANRMLCQTQGDDSQPAWGDAPDWQTQSAINGVQFQIDNPTSAASASYESWFAEKKADGWVYGPEKDPEAKVHPCMVGFEELPPEQQAKDHLFVGIARALIQLIPAQAESEQADATDSESGA